MSQRIGDMPFPEFAEKLTKLFRDLYDQIKEEEAREITKNKELSINKVCAVTGRSYYYITKMIEGGLIPLLNSGKISENVALAIKRRYSNDGSGDAKFLRDIRKLDSITVKKMLKE